MTRKMRKGLKRPRKLPWPPRSVSTEANNDETLAGHFLYPLVAVDFITEWSTAAPAETEIITKAEKTREVCHSHHHSRAVTTIAQHSGGPCSSHITELRKHGLEVGESIYSNFIWSAVTEKVSICWEMIPKMVRSNLINAKRIWVKSP
jgi:hypothetical protein